MSIEIEMGIGTKCFAMKSVEADAKFIESIKKGLSRASVITFSDGSSVLATSSSNGTTYLIVFDDEKTLVEFRRIK